MSTSTTKLLSSSLRIRTAENSLVLAKALAPSRGVSRVNDTTWLDRIGIPVYSSVRPDSHPNSLCVHAGKGATHPEAEIGAYMEAIEYSFTPIGRSHLTWSAATPQAVVDSFGGAIGFVQFCPSVERTVTADEVLAVMSAEEFAEGLGQVLIPAELVYAPFVGNPGRPIYGGTSNGVASGNNVDEATVHAIAEVLERDVQSFVFLGAPTYLVDNATLPPKAGAMVSRIEAAGLQCFVRYCPNDFDLPYLTAYIVEAETDEYSPMSVVAGTGLHCNSAVAAVRAVAEAAQSRVSIIHGGRDDLVRQHSLAQEIGGEAALRHLQRARTDVSDRSRRISFQDIPDAGATTLEAAQRGLLDGMRRAGLRHATRVVYTEPDYPFQVVRVVIPGAEFFEYNLKRMGPRLLQHAVKHNAVRTPGHRAP